MMKVEIRPARPEDAEFLAWVILTAGRAHVTRGIWEVILGGTEQNNLDFLKRLAVTTTPHLFHYSCYLIAEADSRPAAGLGGYDPKICGYEELYRTIPEVLKKMGQSGSPDPETHKRAETVLCCMPEDTEGAWIIDSVATLPEYRRKGLVDRLLVAILEKGRQEGFQKAQISIYIGNIAAQRAYEKHGFKIVDEKRHPDFESEIGSPGMALMLRNL
ncbi:MAG: GNAT family N-acetyltransferase [Desulfobacterales bacterium]|jgi:ribosomal protein S18 acetylase RimI-like enzyme|nr:GNAT family N-acetyltransferase [Desulfobacterales bacterium]